MARISGVDLPRNKRIEIALTYIYGLGRHAANVVLKNAGISPDKKSDDLDEGDVRKIRDAIEQSYRVEGDLRRDVQLVSSISARIAARVIAATCRLAVSVRTPTHVLVRVRVAWP
jgi:ribosomal protein uS13